LLSALMAPTRLFLLTASAMIAFAANSVLCRLALRDTDIDPASFTGLRLLSGALILWLLVRLQQHRALSAGGSWGSALALFAYAAAFSFAYVSLPAGTGALLLFGAVQVTMILGAARGGEHVSLRQVCGLLLAFAGLVILVLPGISAPPWRGSVLMLIAGIAWGLYSLRGRGATDAIAATAGNFLRAVPMAIALSAFSLAYSPLDPRGALYAVLSGAIASGLGYAVWYTALRGLRAVSAASVQLSVPVIAAVGGVIFLGEIVTLRLLFAGLAILGGIAVVLLSPARKV
jgi:drug/metabolite transporter (DMT)-like permease